MSTQMESQQPMPTESGETPAAPEEPNRQEGYESGSVLGITNGDSDSNRSSSDTNPDPPPWTPPPAD